MQFHSWTPVTVELKRIATIHRKLLLILGLATGALNAFAQSVVSTPSTVSVVPAALPQAPVTDSALPAVLGASPFQWGLLTASPHLVYRYLYGNGIQSSPGQQKNTSVQNISPGVLLNIGTHWTLDYTPTQTYYSDPAFKDTLDHAVNIQGGTSYEDWTLRLSQTFASTSQPLIETGRQTSEDDYNTNASAGYHLNDRIQLETTFGYQARFTSVFPDSKESTIGERLHYLFSPGIDTSINVDYGYVNVSSGSDMSYTRPGVQLQLKPTDKLSFSAHAGFENRKFKTPGASSLTSPTFGASLEYRPLLTTTVRFSINHGVSVAYFANQINRSTGWNLDLQQRLFQHFYLSAGYSGQKSTYLSTDPTIPVGRDDQSNSFNLRLSTAIFQRVTVAVFYQTTHNASNDAGFAFTSNQVGVELGYRF